MLSIAAIREGENRRGVRYYLDQVANSRDDYFAGRGEAPGVWMGAGAAALGLSGRVDPEEYLAVMDGRSPDGDTRLARGRGGRRVCGWSLTFSAPKSLSLLWAFGDPELAETVRGAHDRAVAETMSVLEAEAARARRGHDGTTLHDVDGLIAAAFRHRSSRAGDPQLHTHVIVANVVRSIEDRRWSGLDSRGLYDLKMAGGALYRSALRAELDRLGLRWAVGADGLGEVADIDRRVLQAFSIQRQRIQAELERTGHSSAPSAQVAAYRVRPAKDPQLAAAGDDQLRARWAARLGQIRLDGRPARVADIVGCVGRDQHGPTTATEADEALAALCGATGTVKARRPCPLLTERASTVTRAQVIRAVATAVDHTPEAVRNTVERLLARPEMVPLLARAGSGSRPERRRYTTADLLVIEQSLVEGATARQGQACAVVALELVADAEAAHPELSDEQRTVLRRLLASGDGVEVIVGAAGTGKTTLLAAAHHAWQQAGLAVHGAALAALAAGQLQAGSGIAATTLHRLLDDLSRPESAGLDANDVIVIDEAAMVGTRTLAALAERAARAGAKLVLVGDHRQLPEIDAGGGFALLAERLGAAQLTQNRRQHCQWERHALAELRHGSVPAALAAYAEHGRVWQTEDADIARHAIIDRWSQLLDDGVDPAQVLLIAATRDAVDRLGHAAQAHLAEAGRLGQVIAEAVDGDLRAGDRVLLTANHRGLGVRNGDRGRALSATGDQIAVLLDGAAEPTILPEWYVSQHLRQGYAITAHRAQGATVDWALTLIDDAWYRELGYSALSRARQATELYLTGIDLDQPLDHQAPDPPPDPFDALTQRLGHSRADQAALHNLPDLADLGDPVTLRVAWDERDRLSALAGEARTTAGTASTGRPDGDQAQLRQLEAQLRLHEALLGRRARFERPPWAARLLGPLPTSRAGEAAWLTAAGTIAAYHQRWGDTAAEQDTARAGARVEHLRRVHAAHDQLRRCAARSGEPPCPPTRAEERWRQQLGIG